jgi:hypothetical protein
MRQLRGLLLRLLHLNIEQSPDLPLVFEQVPVGCARSQRRFCHQPDRSRLE